jgi:hypothetical protein
MNKTKQQKADELINYVSGIIDKLVYAYIKNMSTDDTVNQAMLELTENEWGKFVYKINSTQKNIVLNHRMFRDILTEALQELKKNETNEK